MLGCGAGSETGMKPTAGEARPGWSHWWPLCRCSEPGVCYLGNGPGIKDGENVSVLLTVSKSLDSNLPEATSSMTGADKHSFA